MIKFIVAIIILVLMQNCINNKGPYTYQVCTGKEARESIIIKNKIIGIVDTTIAFISGHIIDKNNLKPIKLASVILTKENSEKTFGIPTDSLGYFSINIPADNYNLEISSIGYNSIKKNLSFGTGEIREIEVSLGESAAFVTYQITSDKKLNRRQLKKRSKQLKNK
jgi:hypothetical protein